jgi:transposase
MRMFADKIEALLADKGHDADAIHEELAAAEIDVVIPPKRNRQNPVPHDAERYKWRNIIERLFSKLKNWRRFATRYDKKRSPTSASSPSPQSNSGYLCSRSPVGKFQR